MHVLLLLGLLSQAPCRDPLYEVRLTPDIVYGDGPVRTPLRFKTLLLDLYEPEDGGALGDRPAVVLIHGGSFERGSKTEGTIVQLCRYLAARGFVAASIDYRLVPDDPDNPGADAKARAVHAAVSDAIVALNWMAGNARRYRVDSGRLAAGGTSAGGSAAMAAAYVAEWPSSIRAVVDMWGGIGEQLDSIRRGKPPLMVLHGSEDPLVELTIAIAQARRAQEAGLPVEFCLIEGGGHGFPLSQVAGGVPVLDRIVDFLGFHLRVGPYADTPGLRLVSAAGNQRLIAGGSLATVFGSGLGDVTAEFRAPGGESVPAQLFFRTPSQVNLLVPDITGPQTLVLAEQSRPVDLRATAPGLFSAAGYAVRVRSSGESSVEPLSEPLAAPTEGERLILALFGTGIRNHGGIERVAARIGGVRVPVLYAGPQGESPGLDQVNLEVPPNFAARGELSVLVSVEHEASNVLAVTLR